MTKSTTAYLTEQNSFEKFLSYTNEKEILASAITQEISTHYESFLDVGAGNGDLTTHLISSFKRTLLLEPSEPLCKKLTQRFSDTEVINARLEDYNFNQSFDFILASHVFIYLQNPKQAITKLYSLLETEGKLLIVMLDKECGYLRYIDQFTQEVTNISKAFAAEIYWTDLVQILDNYSMKYSVHDVQTKISCPTMQHFLNINDFHFNFDVSSLDQKTFARMKKYLTPYVKNGTFSIDVGHKIIIITK